MVGRDIIITLPKTIAWADYEKELAKVKDGSNEMSFKLPNLPNITKGNRCYVCHNGEVVGWMKVTEAIKSDGFTCTTTGKVWPKGNYVVRSGPFHYITPIEMKGFQGFRYANF